MESQQTELAELLARDKIRRAIDVVTTRCETKPPFSAASSLNTQRVRGP